MKNLYPVTQISKRNGSKKNLSKSGLINEVRNIEKGKMIFAQVVAGGTYEDEFYTYVAN